MKGRLWIAFICFGTILSESSSNAKTTIISTNDGHRTHYLVDPRPLSEDLQTYPTDGNPVSYASFIIAKHENAKPKVLVEEQDRFAFPQDRYRIRVKGPSVQLYKRKTEDVQSAIDLNLVQPKREKPYEVVTMVSNQFHRAGSVQVLDSEGALYVTDSYARQVFRFLIPDLGKRMVETEILEANIREGDENVVPMPIDQSAIPPSLMEIIAGDFKETMGEEDQADILEEIEDLPHPVNETAISTLRAQLDRFSVEVEALEAELDSLDQQEDALEDQIDQVEDMEKEVKHSDAMSDQDIAEMEVSLSEAKHLLELQKEDLKHREKQIKMEISFKKRLLKKLEDRLDDMEDQAEDRTDAIAKLQEEMLKDIERRKEDQEKEMEKKRKEEEKELEKYLKQQKKEMEKQQKEQEKRIKERIKEQERVQKIRLREQSKLDRRNKNKADEQEYQEDDQEQESPMEFEDIKDKIAREVEKELKRRLQELELERRLAFKSGLRSGRQVETEEEVPYSDDATPASDSNEITTVSEDPTTLVPSAEEPTSTHDITDENSTLSTESGPITAPTPTTEQSTVSTTSSTSTISTTETVMFHEEESEPEIMHDDPEPVVSNPNEDFELIDTLEGGEAVMSIAPPVYNYPHEVFQVKTKGLVGIAVPLSSIANMTELLVGLDTTLSSGIYFNANEKYSDVFMDHSDKDVTLRNRYHSLKFGIKDAGERVIFASVDLRDQLEPYPCDDYLLSFNLERNKVDEYFYINQLRRRNADNIFCRPGGIGFCTRTEELYYVDEVTKNVVKMDYLLKSGEIEYAGVVVDLKTKGYENEGRPRGLAFDRHGMLWIGMADLGKVLKMNPLDGQVLEEIAVPQSDIVDVQCDKSQNILFILTQTSLYYIDL
ncbi:reticulocyte-binding protein homolog 2b-like [Tigriopus californicus]|uniref:reticulocyte-binding protein homolog 2b-like n=1 Tax=Tigriopus californicus TaxID=6832 RepID=UPI0027D9FDBC|nr:reticulocyte-binding protein homolog 2b-like [Tigriopus californicus]